MKNWDFPLTSTTIKLYAIAHYKDGNGVWGEFFKDLKTLQTISKKFSSLKNTKDIKLMINILSQLGSYFMEESLARLLFIYTSVDAFPVLKSFLIYMNRMPESIPEIDLSTVVEDKKILENIKKII